MGGAYVGLLAARNLPPGVQGARGRRRRSGGGTATAAVGGVGGDVPRRRAPRAAEAREGLDQPGAFAHYRFREELYPTLTFRRGYDALVDTHGERADVEYVRILKLAAETMECLVDEALARLLESRVRFDYSMVEVLVRPRTPAVPVIRIPSPDLSAYDALLGGAA